MTNLTKVIIQSLQVQLASTDTARARHLEWAAKTHNTEDTAMHLEIAGCYSNNSHNCYSNVEVTTVHRIKPEQ